MYETDKTNAVNVASGKARSTLTFRFTLTDASPDGWIAGKSVRRLKSAVRRLKSGIPVELTFVSVGQCVTCAVHMYSGVFFLVLKYSLPCECFHFFISASVHSRFSF